MSNIKLLIGKQVNVPLNIVEDYIDKEDIYTFQDELTRALSLIFKDLMLLKNQNQMNLSTITMNSAYNVVLVSEMNAMMIVNFGFIQSQPENHNVSIKLSFQKLQEFHKKHLIIQNCIKDLLKNKKEIKDILKKHNLSELSSTVIYLLNQATSGSNQDFQIMSVHMDME